MTAILPSSLTRHTSVARISLHPLLSTQYATPSKLIPKLLCYLPVSANTSKYKSLPTKQTKSLRHLFHIQHPLPTTTTLRQHPAKPKAHTPSTTITTSHNLHSPHRSSSQQKLTYPTLNRARSIALPILSQVSKDKLPPAH
jgi:hypothetical protein